MKINLANKTGKLAGKIVSTSKAAPTKTRIGLSSIKSNFLQGFNNGIDRS